MKEMTYSFLHINSPKCTKFNCIYNKKREHQSVFLPVMLSPTKTATTYSPTYTQYHRRDEA